MDRSSSARDPEMKLDVHAMRRLMEDHQRRARQASEQQPAPQASMEIPQLEVKMSLTNNTYSHSAADRSTSIIVQTTLKTPGTIIVDTRGQWDSGTCLAVPDWNFRGENFCFHDCETGEEISQPTPFPGQCQPFSLISKDFLIELEQGKLHETTMTMDDIDPMCDPIRDLRIGHEYMVTLKAQRIRAWPGKTVQQLMGRKDMVRVSDLPEFTPTELGSGREMRLKVVA